MSRRLFPNKEYCQTRQLATRYTLRHFNENMILLFYSSNTILNADYMYVAFFKQFARNFMTKMCSVWLN